MSAEHIGLQVRHLDRCIISLDLTAVELNCLALCMPKVILAVRTLHVLRHDGGDIYLFELTDEDLRINQWARLPI